MSPRGLLLLLPLLISGVLELGGGHRDHEGHQEETPKSPQRGTLAVWVQTLGATLGVSLAPHLLLFLVPGDSGTPRRRGLLRGLLSFAAGGLLGDAFLHLIPHALAPHDGHGHSHHGHAPHDGHGHSHHGHAPHDGHGHSHHGHGHALSVGFWVLVGIVTFLGVELGVRHCGVRGHGHAHGAPKAKVSSSEDEADGDPQGSKVTKGSKGTKGHPRRSPDGERAGLAASGYLNLAADAAHNFTDGLALGAAFWGGPARGLLTALTVLLHELPHELGDLALLLRAGCTKAQAMKLQLVTALASLAGASCSLLAEHSGPSSSSSSSSSSRWLLPFTAGGFIYLGTVSVLPEILRNPGPGPALRQLLALLAGLAMMLLIAHWE